jgi:hypothetical protein
MLGREAKDIIEGERAVSNGVELVGVSVVLRSSSDLGACSEDELGSGVPLADLV